MVLESISVEIYGPSSEIAQSIEKLELPKAESLVEILLVSTFMLESSILCTVRLVTSVFVFAFLCSMHVLSFCCLKAFKFCEAFQAKCCLVFLPGRRL